MAEYEWKEAHWEVFIQGDKVHLSIENRETPSQFWGLAMSPKAMSEVGKGLQKASRKLIRQQRLRRWGLKR